MKKRLTIVMAVVCCMALMVGTMAFFTDRADANTEATAGNINLVFTDLSAASEHKVTGQTNTVDKVWTDANPLCGDIMNPGDNFDMGYKVANTGSKSIDVKQQIVLTSSVALTDSAEEYKIVIAGQDITPVKSNENKTLTYELAQIVLSGSVEEDGTSTEQEYDVYLAFDRLAKNKFMDSTVTVELDIQAKQHRNTTTGDWVEWASYDTTVEQIADPVS